MYPYTWTWSYTLIALTLLLAVFFLCCAVLLLRRSPRRWHRTPESIATPYGHIPWWDVKTRRMFAVGKARAREREYYNPRGERWQ